MVTLFSSSDWIFLTNWGFSYHVLLWSLCCVPLTEFFSLTEVSLTTCYYGHFVVFLWLSFSHWLRFLLPRVIMVTLLCSSDWVFLTNWGFSYHVLLWSLCCVPLTEFFSLTEVLLNLNEVSLTLTEVSLTTCYYGHFVVFLWLSFSHWLRFYLTWLRFLLP